MIKKLSALIFVLLLALFLTSCTSGDDTSTTEKSTEQTESESTSSAPSDTASSKSAVIYFSKTGNTEKVAHMISDATGAELIKIEPVNPYPEDYDQTVELAQEEQNSNARPEITSPVSDFSQYDTVYFGVPVWWGDLPMPMYTFLDQYDLSGKTVGVFTTHHGSGLGKCVESVESAEPGANVVEGLDVYDEEIDQSKEEVENWAKSVLEAPKE